MTSNAAATYSILITAVKALGALVVLKILALYYGPEGIGVVSNTFSAVAVVSVISIFGSGGGITKLIASAVGAHQIIRVVRISLSLVLISSASLVLIALLFKDRISNMLYNTTEYGHLIVMLSIAALPMGLTALGLAILGGMRRLDLIFICQIFGFIVGSLISFWLISSYGFSGAVMAIFTLPSIPVLVVVYLARHQFKLIPLLFSYHGRDRILLSTILGYSLISVATIFAQNGAHVFYRSEILNVAGHFELGLWQAMIRLSEGYSQVFIVFLMSYLLPTIAAARSKGDILRIVNDAILKVFVSIVCFFTVIYWLRGYIIDFALSNAFSSVSDFFYIQLLSDFFRMMSYVPGVILLATGRIRWAIFLELVQGVIIVYFGNLFIEKLGLAGSFYAYLAAYIFYFFVIYSAYIGWAIKRNAS